MENIMYATLFDLKHNLTYNIEREFRRDVSDVLKPGHNDAYLLRWLRARNWNVKAAEKMFRDSMNWREQWNADNIKDWSAPEVFHKYIPAGLSGYDREGCPIFVVQIKGVDIVGLLHSASRQDFVSYSIQLLEEVLGLAQKNGVDEVVVVFDMEDFNIRPYAWRPAMQLIISLVQMYEGNYPEILKVCYIINAPRVFAIAYNFLKPFLGEYTISKIHIYKSDPKKWQKALKEYIDDDQLAVHYGGTMVDPDGNIRCPSKLRPGGVVPKSYYKKSFSEGPEEEKKDFVQATVKSGDKIKLDYLVVEEGCYLRWEFRTESHDIRFGITSTNDRGELVNVIEHKRVPSHQMEESGVVQCKAPATYTVTFDNTYSKFKSKKLHYHVHLSESVNKLDLNTLPQPDEE